MTSAAASLARGVALCRVRWPLALAVGVGPAQPLSSCWGPWGRSSDLGHREGRHSALPLGDPRSRRRAGGTQAWAPENLAGGCGSRQRKTDEAVLEVYSIIHPCTCRLSTCPTTRGSAHPPSVPPLPVRLCITVHPAPTHVPASLCLSLSLSRASYVHFWAVSSFRLRNFPPPLPRLHRGLAMCGEYRACSCLTPFLTVLRGKGRCSWRPRGAAAGTWAAPEAAFRTGFLPPRGTDRRDPGHSRRLQTISRV